MTDQWPDGKKMLEKRAEAALLDAAKQRREDGIKAIIDLQKMDGIAESREDAEHGWDTMSVREQEFTLGFHTIVFGGPEGLREFVGGLGFKVPR